MQVIYRSLVKDRPWAEHLKAHQRWSWAHALLSVFAFNHKVCPCHVYSDLMLSKSKTKGRVY